MNFSGPSDYTYKARHPDATEGGGRCEDDRFAAVCGWRDEGPPRLKPNANQAEGSYIQ
jgi:hypothetical protein